MPLQKCQDCGKDVSNSAKSCPHCGKPTRESITVIKRKGSKFEAIGFILIVCGVLISYITSSLLGHTLGGLMIFTGFIIFLVGRFL